MKRKVKVRLWRNGTGKWNWSAMIGNAELLSEPYASEANARRGARAFFARLNVGPRLMPVFQ